MDETWVNVSDTASNQWLPLDPLRGRRMPAGRGQMLMVLHAGWVILPGCDSVFWSKSIEGHDCHTEINAEVFIDWIKKQLMPDLPSKSLIVMDNASYHNTRQEGTEAPISNNRKGKMQEEQYVLSTIIHKTYTKLSNKTNQLHNTKFMAMNVYCFPLITGILTWLNLSRGI